MLPEGIGSSDSGGGSRLHRMIDSSGIELLRIRLLEIFFGSARLDRHRTRLPVGGEYFAKLLEVCQGIDHADGFIDASAQRRVVDEHVLQDALLVDQEQAVQGKTGVGEDAVIGADFLGQIGDERVLESTESAFATRLGDPGQVRVLAVDGRTEYLGVVLLKFGNLIAEGDDLRRAHKSKIERIEEEQTFFLPL